MDEDQAKEKAKRISKDDLEKYEKYMTNYYNKIQHDKKMSEKPKSDNMRQKSFWKDLFYEENFIDKMKIKLDI